jgi:hypothetical protein
MGILPLHFSILFSRRRINEHPALLQFLLEIEGPQYTLEISLVPKKYSAVVKIRNS